MSFDINHIPGELIAFKTSDGYELHGFLIKGKNKKKKSGKVLISIHGMTGNFYSWPGSRLMAKIFLQNGYDFFKINTRGHDVVSKYYRNIKGKSESYLGGTAYEKFEDSWKDIAGAVSEMKEKGYKKIILFGHSTGCQKAAYYAYKTNSKDISAVVLMAPADGFNTNKKELGRKFYPTLRLARRLAQRNQKLIPLEDGFNSMSPKRFLSIADLKSVEARLFNYEDNKMKEFSKIKVPICAVFGSNEEYKTKPVRIYLKQLAKVTRSKKFVAVEIKGADHAFKNHEAETAKVVVKWLDKL